MGFTDSKVLWSIKYPISVAAIASDHPQCSQSYGGEQNCPFGRSMAGKATQLVVNYI
jgi:hypothetical protein